MLAKLEGSRFRTSRLYRGGLLAGANAAGDVGQRLGAGDLLPVDGRVVGALEPVAEAELAARLELLGQLRAGVAAETAVLSSPTGGRGAPLVGAGVEDTDAAAGDGKVELALTDVGAGVGGLDDHLLAGDGGGGESKPAWRLAVVLNHGSDN